jgi:hypothetical protein
MSFWIVPFTLLKATPCLRATARYRHRRIAAVALMVIEVETSPRGIPLNSRSMSSSESIATPTFPTSPAESGSSESKPIWVGKSNATDKPVVPCESRYL